jgi:cysteine desulfurase|nr:hypothetical protein [Geitlerinema sp. PCC 9228]
MTVSSLYHIYDEYINCIHSNLDHIIARICDRLAISTGAACSSGVETPSHVLRAIGLPENCIDGALRIGIGKFTTDADIETAAQILTEEIVKIRQLLANT